jgi:hypothetical protein
MRELKILIAAELLAVMGAAHGQSEFDFAYNGNLVSSDGSVQSPWVGTISFVTSSSANGAYTCASPFCVGDGLLSIARDGGPPESFWHPNFGPGFDNSNPLRLTSIDGSIASLGGTFTFGPPALYTVTWSGSSGTLSLSTFFNAGMAILTPAPEPEPWAFLLAGFASIAGFTRMRLRGS